jgi:hypothetical protein|eukprot:COSAG06_NODE_3247_length_5620_cov_3.982612_2_plen_75_part_00
MAFVLDSLQHSYTTAERTFSVFAELVRDVILGLVASVLTTIALSVSSSTVRTQDRKNTDDSFCIAGSHFRNVPR